MSNHHPLVSVIVTSYNRESYLKDNISSILNQSYSNLELIVVDDNSSFDFHSVIDSFDDERIIGFKNDNRGTIAINRNFGIEKSKGEYIAFCDDDDLWEKDKLELQVEKIQSGFDLVFTDIIYINGDDVFKPRSLKGNVAKFIYNVLPSVLSYTFLHFISWIPNSAVLLSRKALGTLRFSEDVRFRASEDYELWLRILRNSKPYYINQGLIKYRLHDNNISANMGNNLKRCSTIFKEKEVTGFYYKMINRLAQYWYLLRYYFVKLKKRG